MGRIEFECEMFIAHTRDPPAAPRLSLAPLSTPPPYRTQLRGRAPPYPRREKIRRGVAAGVEGTGTGEGLAGQAGEDSGE